MKSQTFKQLALSLLFALVLLSCSKEHLKQNPLPEKPSPILNGTVMFSINQTLSGHPYHSSNLQAVVTIRNKANEVVMDEKVLALDLNGTIRSANLSLPAGTYQLTRFRLVYGSVNTHFAAPVTGSAKAAAVQKPLAFEFTVSPSAGIVPVEVLRVAENEGPQQFGYPTGSFDNNQEENNPFTKIKIKATMQVGDVLYDSIPAPLTLTSWNAQGEMTTSYLSLKAGVNEIPLSKAASRYRFHTTKWGTSSELTLEKQNLNASTIYVLSGSKEAKKLKAELTYSLLEGKYFPESKTEYVYNGEGKLFRVYRYLRNSENRPYLSTAEHFQYNGNKLEKISRYNDKNVFLGSTTFRYNSVGKVDNMVHHEGGQQTNATVTYLNNPDEEISINYTFSDQTYTKNDAMKFSNGRMIASTSFIGGQLSESGRFEYDSQINPYLHLNWPDIRFSNSSKHNLVKQFRYYYTAMPLTDPYEFSYTYDADGYPKELVKKFWTLPQKQHIKTTKTVFEYH